MPEISDKTKEIIFEYLHTSDFPVCSHKELEDSHSLRDYLGADSLDEIEIIMEIEETFDIEIKDEDAEQCKTVGDVISLVKGQIETA